MTLRGPPILVQIVSMTEIGSSAFNLQNIRQARIEQADLAGLAEEEDDGEELPSDGDVLGEVTGRSRRRPNGVQNTIPEEEQWEVDEEALEARKVLLRSPYGWPSVYVTDSGLPC